MTRGRATPLAELRARFAAEWCDRLGLAVRPNALEPVFDAALAEPGMHLGCVRQHELGDARCAAVGARLLALAAGAGHEVPTEWFTQDVHH